jgi:hypothetical protein
MKLRKLTTLGSGRNNGCLTRTLRLKWIAVMGMGME